MRAYAKEHVGLTRAVFELYRGVFSCFVVMQASASLWDNACFLLQKQRNNAIKKEVRIMTQKQQFMEKNLFYTSCRTSNILY